MASSVDMDIAAETAYPPLLSNVLSTAYHGAGLGCVLMPPVAHGCATAAVQRQGAAGCVRGALRCLAWTACCCCYGGGSASLLVSQSSANGVISRGSWGENYNLVHAA
jgi:hypothetical protein